MKSEKNRTDDIGEKKTAKKANEKYSRSFLAKLIQSNEQTKKHYSVLKNELLSYKGVKCSFDWPWEAFSVGRKALAKIRLRGKTLSICLALNPEDYMGTKYQVESAGVKSLADTPCLYVITDYKQLMYAVQLIGVLMGREGIEKTPIEEIDYIAQYPYESDAALIKKKLIKVSTSEDVESDTEDISSDNEQSVPVQEALLQDEVATSPIEKTDSVSDKTKSDIVNIDTLSQCFAAGERVTLNEIKKRVKGFDKKVTCIKVLARGKLEKSLTVEADKFSAQAAKKIALAGGKAIKKAPQSKA